MEPIHDSLSQSVPDIDDDTWENEITEYDSAYKMRRIRIEKVKAQKAEATNIFVNRTKFFACLLIVEWSKLG